MVIIKRMMSVKGFFAAFAAVVAIAMASVSCEIETSDNGDLDGYWHLNRVDTLSTGGVCDMSEKLMFWAVQVKLLNTFDRSGQSGSYMFRFEHKDGNLRLYDPHKDDRMSGDPKVESPEELTPFGVNSLDETFKIERLSGSRMVLSNDKLRLSFNKL